MVYKNEIIDYLILYSLSLGMKYSISDELDNVILYGAQTGTLELVSTKWPYRYMASHNKTSKWYNGKHRKYLGVLNLQLFDDLIHESDLIVHDKDTSGFEVNGKHFNSVYFTNDPGDEIRLKELHVSPVYNSGRVMPKNEYREIRRMIINKFKT